MSARLTIVAINDTREALALRAMLEQMDHEVRLLRVTATDDIGTVLRRASEDDVVILSAVGSARGLALGTDWVPMVQAFSGVSFRDEAVLFSTASGTRESGLVQVMLNAGGRLVAPNGTPDRAIVVPWIGACLLGADQGLAQAVSAANALVTPQNRFSYG